MRNTVHGPRAIGMKLGQGADGVLRDLVPRATWVWTWTCSVVKPVSHSPRFQAAVYEGGFLINRIVLRFYHRVCLECAPNENLRVPLRPSDVIDRSR